ncbi:MAG: hypothetical protein J6Y29_04010 [Clostridiales bacterium]|nr:hypothetical protein [Clostridiales bacterium]
MKKGIISELTNEEIMQVEGGMNKFSQISFTFAGVVLLTGSVFMSVSCSPVIGVAALGTGIACLETGGMLKCK